MSTSEKELLTGIEESKLWRARTEHELVEFDKRHTQTMRGIRELLRSLGVIVER
jgi:hypothetical protein